MFVVVRSHNGLRAGRSNKLLEHCFKISWPFTHPPKRHQKWGRLRRPPILMHLSLGLVSGRRNFDAFISQFLFPARPESLVGLNVYKPLPAHGCGNSVLAKLRREVFDFRPPGGPGMPRSLQTGPSETNYITVS